LYFAFIVFVFEILLIIIYIFIFMIVSLLQGRASQTVTAEDSESGQHYDTDMLVFTFCINIV